MAAAREMPPCFSHFCSSGAAPAGALLCLLAQGGQGPKCVARLRFASLRSAYGSEWVNCVCVCVPLRKCAPLVPQPQSSCTHVSSCIQCIWTPATAHENSASARPPLCLVAKRWFASPSCAVEGKAVTLDQLAKRLANLANMIGPLAQHLGPLVQSPQTQQAHSVQLLQALAGRGVGESQGRRALEAATRGSGSGI